MTLPIATDNDKMLIKQMYYDDSWSVNRNDRISVLAEKFELKESQVKMILWSKYKKKKNNYVQFEIPTDKYTQLLTSKWVK